MAEARAIVFDLDDTLYPHAWFAQSGFMAVARRLEADFGVRREPVLRLLRTMRRLQPGLELQALCRHFGLPMTLVPGLVSTIRTHRPSIRLPEPSTMALARLRADWRIGVLTNGMPSVQRRKMEALGLAPLVDVIVYAEEHGERGKPEAAPFHAVLERLEACAGRTVFVGDDPVADIAGARRAGLRTIYVSASRDPWPANLPRPDARLSAIGGVPCAAEQLVPGTERRHVA